MFTCRHWVQFSIFEAEVELMRGHVRGYLIAHSIANVVACGVVGARLCGGGEA